MPKSSRLLAAENLLARVRKRSAVQLYLVFLSGEKSANIHYIALPGSDWRTLLIDLNQTLLKLYKVCCVVVFFFCCSMLFFLDSLLLVICKSGERFLMRIRSSVGKVFLCSVVFELVSVC